MKKYSSNAIYYAARSLKSKNRFKKAFYQYKLGEALQMRQLYLHKKKEEHRMRKQNGGVSSRIVSQSMDGILVIIQYIHLDDKLKSKSTSFEQQAIRDYTCKKCISHEDGSNGTKSLKEGTKKLLHWWLFAESDDPSRYMICEVYQYCDPKLYRKIQTKNYHKDSYTSENVVSKDNEKKMKRKFTKYFSLLSSTNNSTSNDMYPMDRNNINRVFNDSLDKMTTTIESLSTMDDENPESSSLVYDTVWLDPKFDVFPISAYYWMAIENSPNASLENESPQSSLSTSLNGFENNEIKAVLKYVHVISEYETLFLKHSKEMIKRVHEQLKGQIFLSISRQVTITSNRPKSNALSEITDPANRGSVVVCSRFLMISIYMTPTAMAMQKRNLWHKKWTREVSSMITVPEINNILQKKPSKLAPTSKTGCFANFISCSKS